MKKLLTAAMLLLSFTGFGQNRVQNYIDGKMKTDSLLINAVVGILAVDKDGREIASWNPDMPLLTASTMKTITTGLGYEVLGPDYRFSTKVAYDGKIYNDDISIFFKFSKRCFYIRNQLFFVLEIVVGRHIAQNFSINNNLRTNIVRRF